MFSWSKKRQFLFLLIPIFIFIVLVFFVYYKIFNKPPTCFDKKQNGTESGVDCGGQCLLICQNTVIDPVIVWAKSFEINNGVWNATAYIENPNSLASAKNVPYEFKLYDEESRLILSRDGVIDIPKGKAFAIFEGGLNSFGRMVKNTQFSWTTNSIIWQKDKSDDKSISITHGPVLSADTNPGITGQILNNTFGETNVIELVALVFDTRKNVIATSKTLIDKISPKSNANFVFTWQKPFNVNKNVCDKKNSIVLLLDVSTSTSFTGIKNDIKDFVSSLHFGDDFSLITFGQATASSIYIPASSDFKSIKENIENITIQNSTSTDINNSLDKANTILSGTKKEKILIIVSTNDLSYPKENSLKDNIFVYAIGIGETKNKDILLTLAKKEDNVFLVNSVNLKNIFYKIENNLCNQDQYYIEIIPRFIK